MTPRNITILGSTGSIGTQALNIVRQHPDKFNIVGLSARNNAQLLLQQCLEFAPQMAVLTNPQHAPVLQQGLANTNVAVGIGTDALTQLAQLPTAQVVLTALVGFSGVVPTLAAIEAGKHIALANKETLVVAGHLVTAAAKQAGVHILPVDSEHSAIFQCLQGEQRSQLEKIILTASGGPFRGYSRHDLQNVTPAHALKHPNWTMGAKVTIDSASLMNKGLEAIEAKWLFNLKASEIEVVVHPQSIMHSAVQFVDGSIIAQMGLPDMHLPIQYALTWPNRAPLQQPRCHFAQLGSLTFETPNYEAFPNLRLALEALDAGHSAPCVLNAANEVTVELFLQNKISFNQISDINAAALAQTPLIKNPNLVQLQTLDANTRQMCYKLANQFAQ